MPENHSHGALWLAVSSADDLTPGLYGFADLKDVLESAHSSMRLMVNRVNGLVTLAVDVGWEVQLTDGLLGLLGLDEAWEESG